MSVCVSTEHLTGEIRIFGPPGTGKTTTLSGLIERACGEVGSAHVVAASFTKTAAKELVARNLPIDDDHIGTLHALAYRAIGSPHLVSKKDLPAWNEQYPYLAFGGVRVNIDDPYADWESTGTAEGDRRLSDYDRLRGQGIPDDHMPTTLQDFATKWRDFKDQSGLLDFTDLIETAVRDALPVPHRARVLFLDEVQDFSPLELRLARQWGAQCERYYMAGDDDQCLYAFKGCSPSAFLSPTLPASHVMLLSQSYRVPRAVHARAASWIEQIAVRQPKHYRPRDAEGALTKIEATYRNVDPLYHLIERVVAEGKTIAIIASCSYMVDPIKHRLREWGFAFHNPWRPSRGDWNPLRVKAGTLSAGERVLAFRKVKDTGTWWTYADLAAWATPLESAHLFAHGAKTEIRQRAEREGSHEAPVSIGDLTRWFTDPSVANLATEGDLTWYRGRLLDTYRKPLDYAATVVAMHGSAALRRTPQITIGTVHSLKGSEFDHVVLFPDLSQSGLAEWEGWSGLKDGRDAVIRMLYVGLTRARECCHIAQCISPAVWNL